MPKYIDADALRMLIIETCQAAFQMTDTRELSLAEIILDGIEQLPPEPVRQEVHAAWVLFDEDANAWSCTACDEPQIFIEGTPKQNEYRFCPHCGATMDLDAKGAEG